MWCDRLTEKLKGKVKVVFSSGRGKAVTSSVTQLPPPGQRPPLEWHFPFSHRPRPSLLTTQAHAWKLPPRLVKGRAVLFFPIELVDPPFTLAKAITKADQPKCPDIFCDGGGGLGVKC